MASRKYNALSAAQKLNFVMWQRRKCALAGNKILEVNTQSDAEVDEFIAYQKSMKADD